MPESAEVRALKALNAEEEEHLQFLLKRTGEVVEDYTLGANYLSKKRREEQTRFTLKVLLQFSVDIRRILGGSNGGKDGEVEVRPPPQDLL